MYSPDGESLAGEAGISAGSEGVAIHGKDIWRTLTIQAKHYNERPCVYVFH